MSDWRNSREYRVWRAEVIRRDKRCVICNSIKYRHAHHLNHATYFPKERFLTANGICLCRHCHMNFHCNFKRSYRTKCTEYDFFNFIQLYRYFTEVERIKMLKEFEKIINKRKALQ